MRRCDVRNRWRYRIRAGDRHLKNGPVRYTDLQHSIPGISQRMLTHTLRQLRRDGLVTRTAYPEVPPRVEYALTGLGTTLLDAVTALIDWAGTHHDEITRNRAHYDNEASGS
ncbi:winged helix-turn-helix transcriptional regulator [Streptomyces sp. SAI-218]|uniref:winged helix-turn-helix transcriptional regulator n=1 Tax=Streptomyces sp. SAI-218 TaxID=3377736 RepID=UPI003C7A2B8C